MFTNASLKIFKLEDLIGRTVKIQSFTDNNIELITARDTKTGDLFVLREIQHAEQIKED